MESLNNGSVVDFNLIKDYQNAAKDFAEGNKELEQLLLNCFGKRIETVSCCGGHEDKNRKPYISISYSLENEQLIYAILSNLKDRGFNFRYNKLPNGKSFFSIEEGQTFDFSKASTLFNDINSVINSFDMEKDYYSELPKDLQKYGSIVKISENDELLKIEGTSDYFQMCYEKLPDGYEYSLITSDSYYNSMARKANFTKLMMEFPAYNLKVPNREMATPNLQILVENIQFLEDKREEQSNFQQGSNGEEELKIEFEYDESVRDNPLISHLKVNFGDSIMIIAQKLIECRKRGINAFVIFNGIELNNYTSNNPQQIIDAYNQKRKEIKELKAKKELDQERYEHFIQMRDSQRQQDQLIRQQQLEQLLFPNIKNGRH